MRSPRLALLAAAVLMLEAVGLLVVVAIESMQFATGGATSPTTGGALIALTALAAVVLVLLSVNVARGRSWARSGGVVLHVLAILTAFSVLAVPPPASALAATLGIPGVVGLVLLLASARAEGAAGPASDRDATSRHQNGPKD